VVIVNRRFYVYDGASGERVGPLQPTVGEPPEGCPGCYYTIGTDVVIDAVRGLTATITYTVAPDNIYETVLTEVNKATESIYYEISNLCGISTLIHSLLLTRIL